MHSKKERFLAKICYKPTENITNITTNITNIKPFVHRASWHIWWYCDIKNKKSLGGEWHHIASNLSSRNL